MWPRQDHFSYQIYQPNEVLHPIMLSAPHAGRELPDRLLQNTRLSPQELLATADLDTEKLIAPIHDYPLIHARFARSLVDLNRPRNWLDPAVVEGAPKQRAAKVKTGYGVIPRFARHGTLIHERPLSREIAENWLQNYYDPYHQALSSWLAKLHHHFKHYLLVDIHSAPEIALGDTDIQFGSNFGQSTPPQLVELFESAFRDQGFDCVCDYPFAGGYITQHYAHIQKNKFCLQIEVNRKYLNPIDPQFLKAWQIALQSAITNSQQALGAGKLAAE